MVWGVSQPSGSVFAIIAVTIRPSSSSLIAVARAAILLRVTLLWRAILRLPTLRSAALLAAGRVGARLALRPAAALPTLAGAIPWPASAAARSRAAVALRAITLRAALTRLAILGRLSAAFLPRALLRTVFSRLSWGCLPALLRSTRTLVTRAGPSPAGAILALVGARLARTAAVLAVAPGLVRLRSSALGDVPRAVFARLARLNAFIRRDHKRLGFCITDNRLVDLRRLLGARVGPHRLPGLGIIRQRHLVAGEFHHTRFT